MFSRHSTTTFRAAMVAVALSAVAAASIATPSDAAKKRAPTTRKPTTTTRATATTRPVVTSAPTTTISKLPKANADVLAAYDEFTKVFTAGLREPEKAPTLYPTVMTDKALEARLAGAKRNVSEDSWFDVTSYETFDVRVISATQTSVELSVCERIRGPRMRRSDDRPIIGFPGDVEPFITHKNYLFIQSPDGKWRDALDTHNEDVEGKSTCADGR